MGSSKLPTWAPIAMAGWRAMGETYQQIGERFGVTREAVRLTLAKIGKDGRLPKPEACIVPDCGRGLGSSRRYCALHAARARRSGGDPGPAGLLVTRNAGSACLECDAPAVRKGRCERHYQHWLYHNHPGRRERVLAAIRRYQKRVHRPGTPQYERYRAYQRAYYLRRKAKRQQEAQQP